MKINIESDFQPLGNPKSESASAHVGIIPSLGGGSNDQAMIDELQQLPNLQTLNLVGTAVTTNGLMQLKNHKLTNNDKQILEYIYGQQS